ncbi:MAG: universal stress protein [Microcystaceae cyanobacterium]
MSYQKILIAIDRSPLGAEIFQQGIALAKQNNASLMLFHCVPLESQVLSPYPSFYSEEMLNFSTIVQERLQQELTETQQWLESYVKKAQELGINTEFDWKVGEPGRWIRDLSISWQADLIIIGRRGLTGIKEMFLGSISNYVIHHAQCSVLVVQNLTSSTKN